MPQVDPPPSSEEIEKRRKPKYIIDPKDMTSKDQTRARAWAAEVMKRHESKLTMKVKDRNIIVSGVVEPEAIDVRNIYPFSNLHWVIYRNGDLFDLMLMSGKRMLFVSSFAKVQ